MKGFSKKVKDFFIPTTDAQLKRELDMLNINTIRFISFIGALMELIALMLLLFDATTTRDRIMSGLSVGIAAIICYAAYLISTLIKRFNKYNHYAINIIITLFFIVLFGFAIFVSCRHYMQGDQIIIFYIVALCFVSFVIVPPIIGIPMVMLSFIVFFTILYFFDKTENIQGFNYFALADLCAVASVIKYRITLREVKQNIEKERLNNSLEKMIRYDYLTKAKNRYALIEDSKEYYNKEIIVCMSDIDKFKKINDTYGHLIGDRVILAISETFDQCCDRESIYRYGGDEFLIISDFIDEDDLSERKRKLNETISNLEIDGVNEKVDCSFGTVHGIAKNGNEFEEMIKQADLRLYEEKKRKRSLEGAED